LTAAPLAQVLGVTAIEATDEPARLAHRVLHEHSGGRILIVGHSDTVPAIVAALSGASAIPPIDALEYGTMYIVTVPRIGHANFVRLTY
jgi:broad specificity phosphatase PhoE